MRGRRYGAKAIVLGALVSGFGAGAAFAAKVPNSCIEIQQSQRTSESCPGNRSAVLYRTIVRSMPLSGCPATILIAYVDPADGQPHGAIAARDGRTIETCGEGPRAVSIVEDLPEGGRVTTVEPPPPPPVVNPAIKVDAGVAQPPPPPPEIKWNAIAASLGRLKDGRASVAIGYSGVKSSAAEATASAIAECRKFGGANCEVKGPWSQGCVFITTGSNTKGASWYSAAVKEDAVKRCRQAGYNCREPIGGCVQ